MGWPTNTIDHQYALAAEHQASIKGVEAVADEAQVKLLKEQGVTAWNKWRKANPKIRPRLHEANLGGADLSEANLSGADLSKANLHAANLQEADLSGANFSGANLSRAVLIRTNLGQANLFRAILIGANFSGANLNRAHLSRANLSGAVFNRANLTGVNLSVARLFGTDLTQALLIEADFKNCSMVEVKLGNVDLSRTKGLETVEHGGPSIVGIDTIYRSGGNIPEIFLRGAGVPEPFIIQMKSLVAAMSPIEFYSCFISYSSKDQEFAERLHADLRSKGVRCWFAPEDLKIGDKLRPSFDEAIRVHDKLMVLLSESSVKSPWVEKEVETAFEKERQQNRTVLFPIRLDEAVMKTDKAWAADIRRTRHIGDFRNWKDHDSYKKAFDRLLRDLKAEDKAAHA
jgi:hypothetical protein